MHHILKIRLSFDVFYVTLIYCYVTNIAFIGEWLQFINCRGIEIKVANFHTEGTTSYWWTALSCNGTESTISNCILSAWWQSSSCQQNAGVICGEPGIIYTFLSNPYLLYLLIILH